LRVTNANIYLVTVDTLHPVVLELSTDAGIAGIGEAAVAYGIGATAAAAMLKDLAQHIIIGRDPFRIEELWSEMYDHSFWAKGGGPIVFAAISAIEQALWDIKGKALGVPVYELLGGPVPSSWLTNGGILGLYIASVKSRTRVQRMPQRVICLMANDLPRTHMLVWTPMMIRFLIPRWRRKLYTSSPLSEMTSFSAIGMAACCRVQAL
jgi:hypothetical protein